MPRPRSRYYLCALPLATMCSAGALAAPCAEPKLEDAAIHAVLNATDEDAQIIFKGGFEEGLTSIRITGPNGNLQYSADFPAHPKIGQADFQFDSVEPSLGKLKRAFPAGLYRFAATTSAGCTLSRRLRLTYGAVTAPVIVFPSEGSTGIPAAGFTAMWEAIPDADAVQVAVEVEEDGTKVVVDLPGDATSFHVPADFLKPNVLYTMDVIGIAANGNESVADVQFTTGP